VHEWAPEVVVDEALAGRLVGEQFPELERRTFRFLGAGWDTTVWVVDESWVFRFPRREMVVRGLLSEIAHLRRLAPLLPLSIPVPTLVGEPSEAFRWPFYGAPFLPGRELAHAALDEEARARLAVPLAEFLRTLHGLRFEADLPLDPVRRADMPSESSELATGSSGSRTRGSGPPRLSPRSCSSRRSASRRRNRWRSATGTCTSGTYWWTTAGGPSG
jgi:aminoglycoside phosphotransferase (APT) family kinase protein